MTTIAVDVHRSEESAVPTRQELEADLDRARRLARLLDSEFEVAGFRFGVDAIVGLVPVAGDTISLLAGLYPIHLARKHGMGKWVERKMIANLLIDYIGGLMPVAGDVFDAVFKANLKNVALLERSARSARVGGKIDTKARSRS